MKYDHVAFSSSTTKFFYVLPTYLIITYFLLPTYLPTYYIGLYGLQATYLLTPLLTNHPATYLLIT